MVTSSCELTTLRSCLLTLSSCADDPAKLLVVHAGEPPDFAALLGADRMSLTVVTAPEGRATPICVARGRRAPSASSSQAISPAATRKDFCISSAGATGWIKTLGHRVGPDEIVEVLHVSGEVVEALVDAEEDEERGTRIVAYVVLVSGGSVERLRAFCRDELPRYMQPSRIEMRTALARTASGKHDLNAERASHAYG